MPIIYHVTTQENWQQVQSKAKQNEGRAFYIHPSLQKEGFIHCSQEHQVAGVLERYFSGQDSLVKLVIDTDKLTSKFVFDWSKSNADTFPHVYGPINSDAVIDTLEVK